MTDIRGGDGAAPADPMDERQAARYLGISRHTLAKLRKKGEIECFSPVPKVHRYSRAALEAFKAERTTKRAGGAS